jgi:hypothetical protein
MCTLEAHCNVGVMLHNGSHVEGTFIEPLSQIARAPHPRSPTNFMNNPHTQGSYPLDNNSSKPTISTKEKQLNSLLFVAYNSIIYYGSTFFKFNTICLLYYNAGFFFFFSNFSWTKSFFLLTKEKDNLCCKIAAN